MTSRSELRSICTLGSPATEFVYDAIDHLRPVNWMDVFDGVQLNNTSVINEQVQPIETVEQ